MNTTSMPQCTVTVDDVYGAGWWEDNVADVSKHRTEFRQAKDSDRYISPVSSSMATMGGVGPKVPLLIILGPAMPRLREVYGADEVTIPAGWEWTGEYRVPMHHEWNLDQKGWPCANCDLDGPRLILRRTEPKVWFKAEEKIRQATEVDWAWNTGRNNWVLWDIDAPSNAPFLCATRHEEPTPAYTLTQEMVDAGRVR